MLKTTYFRTKFLKYVIFDIFWKIWVNGNFVLQELWMTGCTCFITPPWCSVIDKVQESGSRFINLPSYGNKRFYMGDEKNPIWQKSTWSKAPDWVFSRFGTPNQAHTRSGDLLPDQVMLPHLPPDQVMLPHLLPDQVMLPNLQHLIWKTSNMGTS